MSKVAEKQKIRDKYRGVSPDELEKIPAIEEKNIFEDDVHMRVAVYARVSTDDPRQTSSFELQRNHYTDLIDRHPNWHLVKIYAGRSSPYSDSAAIQRKRSAEDRL